MLNLGGGADLDQARPFLSALDLSLFLEDIDARPEDLDFTTRCACSRTTSRSMSSARRWGCTLPGIRARYPEWRHLADGDGGDENLKDYPIEENAELTIRSVVDNLMLYQEGWGSAGSNIR